MIIMLDFTAIDKALLSLKESLEVFQDTNFIEKLNEKQVKTIRAGVIQNFEFTYELSWKFIKRWLENNIGNTEVDGVSHRQLFRLAAESNLISDIDQWMLFHKYRNLTSHTYDENTAREVANISQVFSTTCQSLVKTLKQKND